MSKSVICLLFCVAGAAPTPGLRAQTPLYPGDPDLRREEWRHQQVNTKLAQAGVDATTQYNNDLLDCQGNPSTDCVAKAARKYSLTFIEIRKQQNIENGLHQKNVYAIQMNLRYGVKSSVPGSS